MRILFAGSTVFAVPVLEKLIELGLVVGLLTTPDRPAHRGLKLRRTPTKEKALAHDIPVFEPVSVRGDVITRIRSLNPDVLVCVAYGKIFGPAFLSLFNRGTVNVHPSLLPRFRGASPVLAAVLSGDVETGVTLQKMSVEMDCGDILLQSKYTITQEDTTETVLQTLSTQSVTLIETLLSDYDHYYTHAVAQDSRNAVYCQKITSEYGYVNWMESAQQIAIMTRAFSPPYSGVKFRTASGIIKVWSAVVVSDNMPDTLDQVGTVLGTSEKGILVQCRKGILAITMMQTPGKKKLYWQDFLRGKPEILKTKFR